MGNQEGVSDDSIRSIWKRDISLRHQVKRGFNYMSMFMLNNSILFGSMWTCNLMGNPREEHRLWNSLLIYSLPESEHKNEFWLMISFCNGFRFKFDKNNQVQQVIM